MGVLQVGLRVTLSCRLRVLVVGASDSNLTALPVSGSDAPLGSIGPSDASDPLHRGYWRCLGRTPEFLKIRFFSWDKLDVAGTISARMVSVGHLHHHF